MGLPYAVLMPLMPEGEHGAMWVITSAAIFASLPFLSKLRAERGDRARLHRQSSAEVGASSQ